MSEASQPPPRQLFPKKCTKCGEVFVMQVESDITLCVECYNVKVKRSDVVFRERLGLILFQFDTAQIGDSPTGVYAVPATREERAELWNVIREAILEGDGIVEDICS